MIDPVRSALVTGAAGFVGRWLCEELALHGVRMQALDLVEAPGRWENIHCIDLTRDDDLGPVMEGVDTVFHLAGLAHSARSGLRAREAYRSVNVEATRRLVRMAVAYGVSRFVLMSSVKALGEGDKGPLDDHSPPRPTSDYGRSKFEAEQIVLQAGRESGMHAAVIRSALVYGPGVKGNLRAMIEAVAAGRFPPLAETGNRRSLVDVRDVAHALWLAANDSTAAGRAYVVTDGQVYSTRRILDAIRDGLGLRQPRLSIGPGVLKPLAVIGTAVFRLTGRTIPYDMERHDRLFGSAEYCGADIQRELGFRPRHALEDAAAILGLEELVVE